MQRGNIHDFMNQNDTITQYARRNSNASSEPQEVAPHYVKYVDFSDFFKISNKL